MGRTYHLGKKMTTSPAKSKIQPPALGLDPPPKKKGKTKNTKNAQNGPEIILAIFFLVTKTL